MQDYWLKAINGSVNVYFSLQAGEGNYPFYFEGSTPLSGSADYWTELRLNGPVFKEQTKGYWKVNFGLDFMCAAKSTLSNAYVPQVMAGFFQSKCIDLQIYNVGEGLLLNAPLNYESPFFCAQQVGPHQVNQWGRMKPDVEVNMVSLEVNYQGEFQWPLSI